VWYVLAKNEGHGFTKLHRRRSHQYVKISRTDAIAQPCCVRIRASVRGNSRSTHVSAVGMIAPNYSNSAQPPEQRKTPAVRLEESLRDLVHEEMGVVRSEAQKPIPSRSDAFWLFLCVADAALIIWLLPDAVLGDKRLELLSKLFTWLGGSLFVLGYVWFRELFLAFVRHRAFRIVLLAIPALVFPAYVTQAPVFFVKPQVDPPNAEVVIKGRPVHITGIRLPLQSEEEVVVTVRGEGNNPQVYTKGFKLTRSDIWRTWWRDEQPYFALRFYVPLTFVGGVPEIIELVKDEGGFDREFRESGPKLTFRNQNGLNEEKPGMLTENNRITFSVPKQPLAGVGITVPYGKYSATAVFSDQQGCDKTAVFPFMAKPGVESPNSGLIEVERLCGGKNK
jgi:hypothetical protein